MASTDDAGIFWTHNCTYINIYNQNLIHGTCGLLLFPVILVILFLMLFIYKTYKTTFQRLTIYYVILSLWFDVSVAGKFFRTIFEASGYNIDLLIAIEQCLVLSSYLAWYIYIISIANFSLLFTLCLIRGQPLSKRINRCMECICVISAIAIGLTVGSITGVNYDYDNMSFNPILCVTVIYPYMYLLNLGSEMISVLIYFVLDLELVIVSLSLCVAFWYIHQKTQNRQTAAVLLRNSVCLVGVNAAIMGLDSFRMGYNIWQWHELNTNIQYFYPYTAVLLSVWDVLFMLVLSVSVIFQAVLCIQTSTRGNTCCKKCCQMNNNQNYIPIDGEDIATNPASSRISPPSQTYFSIPYTSLNDDTSGEDH